MNRTSKRGAHDAPCTPEPMPDSSLPLEGNTLGFPEPLSLSLTTLMSPISSRAVPRLVVLTRHTREDVLDALDLLQFEGLAKPSGSGWRLTARGAESRKELTTPSAYLEAGQLTELRDLADGRAERVDPRLQERGFVRASPEDGRPAVSLLGRWLLRAAALDFKGQNPLHQNLAWLPWGNPRDLEQDTPAPSPAPEPPAASMDPSGQALLPGLTEEQAFATVRASLHARINAARRRRAEADEAAKAASAAWNEATNEIHALEGALGALLGVYGGAA